MTHSIIKINVCRTKTFDCFNVHLSSLAFNKTQIIHYSHADMWIYYDTNMSNNCLKFDGPSKGNIKYMLQICIMSA